MLFKFSRESLVRWYFILIAVTPVCIVMSTPNEVMKRKRAKGQYVLIDQLQAENATETLLPIEMLYVPSRSSWVVQNN